MIRFLILLLFIAILNSENRLFGQCMTYPVSFVDRVVQSQAIIEGKVVARQSFWNPTQDFIYTSHVIDVYKVFKGNIASTQVEIITEGGIVGSSRIIVEPNLELKPEDVGTFFLTTPVYVNTLSPFYPNLQFSAYALHQGFIHYDLKSQSGYDPFNTYPSIPTDIYQVIENILNHPFTEIIHFNLNVPGQIQYRMMVPPVISSITPATSTAGTFSLVTISGNNFGNGPFGGTRNLEWRDANNGGAGFVSTPANHIISWTNTSIQAWVPTQAGSGTIRVTNDLNESTVSAVSITINYNETNVIAGGIYYQPDLVNRNGTGGYTYTYNTTFNGNAPAVAAFERALQTWRCGTYVNFSRSGTTATACQALDGINLVTFDGSCPLPAGVLGISYSYYATCGTGVWYLNENDLKFRTNGTGGINWNYGPAPTAGGLYDFESVCVHELGHSHQLGHTILTPPSVMHFSIGPNTDRRTLTASSEIAGGNDIMSRSVVNNSCGPSAMIALTAANCAIAAPVANFSGTPLTGCNTLTVTFTDLSLNNPTSWNWSFPGGVPATFNGQNPPPIFYGAPGTYSVTLTVSNAFGSDTHTKTNYITVNNCPPPVADFYGDPTTVCQGQQVKFYDLSTNNPTSWSWTFPGGTPATSSLQNPVITYNTPGVYNVTLTATNAYGSNTITKTAYITVVTCPPPPVANFSGTPTTLCAGSSVSFTDLSTGSPTSWNWTFPGGSPLTSIAQNPVVTYNIPGVYSVTLTVSNSNGSSTLTLTNYITVNVCSPPVANFAGNPLLICAGQAVSFVDLSTNSPTAWSWVFPGGTPGTSTAQNPVITYNTPGVYNVSLTATNAFGSNTHVKTNYINVVACPAPGSGLIVNDGGFIFLQPGITVTVQGGIINQDNGVYIGEWDNRGTITLTGDWTNNSAGNAFINTTAGTFVMLGANQLITGSTPTHFYNLTLSGSGIKRQTVNAYTYGILELNDRELATDGNIMYVMNPAVGAITRAGGMNSTPVQGFVSSTGNGRLYRATNSANFYLFPVGSSLTTPRFRPVELRPNSSAAAAYAVRFVNHDANLDGYNRAIKDPTLGVINPYWYQKIERISGNLNTDVRLYVDNVQDNVSSFTTLQMTEWGYTVPPVQWRHITGNSAIPATSPALGSVTKAAWNIFTTENFNIAPESVPLPVELLSFAAECKNNRVEITWATASETNCDYFIIERSLDGNSFAEIGRIKGAGSSNQLLWYSFSDVIIADMKVYYRLVQVDFDGGQHTFLPVIAFCRSHLQGIQIISVYPTPFTDELIIEFTSEASQRIILKMLDAAGRLVSEKLFDTRAGYNKITWDVSQLAAGFYHLELAGTDARDRFKLVKSR